MEGWHYLRADRKLAYPPHTLVEVGATLILPTDEVPVLCRRGFHASVNAWGALRYAPRSKELYACRVRLGGRIVADTDKHVASERTVLAMVPARRVLVGWAAWAASGALLGRAMRGPVDPRSWAAIEAVEAWLRGERTDEQMHAAAAAAAAAVAPDNIYAAAAAAAAAAATDNIYAAAAAAAAVAAAAATDNIYAAAAAAAAAATRSQARALLNTELERRLITAMGG